MTTEQLKEVTDILDRILARLDAINEILVKQASDLDK